MRPGHVVALSLVGAPEGSLVIVLEVLRAAVGPPSCEQSREDSNHEEEDEERRGIVEEPLVTGRIVVSEPYGLTRFGRHRTLADLLRQLNPVLRGWCVYFRHGVSSRTFSYLDHFAWWRVVGWLRKRHVGLSWGTLIRRYLPGWEVRDGRTAMFRPQTVPIERYRFRGTRIPTPWASRAEGSPVPAA